MIKAVELAKLLNCSESTATKKIAQMNQELKEQGYMTIRGSIPISYVYKRFPIKEEQS
jgi:transcriptional antiterminator